MKSARVLINNSLPFDPNDVVYTTEQLDKEFVNVKQLYKEMTMYAFKKINASPLVQQEINNNFDKCTIEVKRNFYYDRIIV
jgi:hypothetical protein